MWYILLFLSLFGTSESLDVDCDFPNAGEITCHCLGNVVSASTNGVEDLSDIVGRSLQGAFFDTFVRHIRLVDCGNLHILVNFRTFVVDGRVQNVTDLSFEFIDDLNLIIEDIDYGFKQFIFKGVRNLELSGYLEHPSTRVSFYVHNDRVEKGDVTFRDFLANSEINLINIQDARSVRVIDSAFEQLRDVDLLRTDSCYVGDSGYDSVDCNKDDLFISTVFIGPWYRHPLFIAGIVLLIILILLAIFACFYYRRWRRKKDLELIGYPASTLSRAATPTPVGPIGHTGNIGHIGPIGHTGNIGHVGPLGHVGQGTTSRIGGTKQYIPRVKY